VIHDHVRQERNCVSLYDREINIRETRLLDRFCDSYVVFRGELLNYYPALHALNQPERKRERKKSRIVFAGTFSRQISRIMRTYRIGEGSVSKLITTDRLRLQL